VTARGVRQGNGGNRPKRPWRPCLDTSNFGRDRWSRGSLCDRTIAITPGAGARAVGVFRTPPSVRESRSPALSGVAPAHHPVLRIAHLLSHAPRRPKVRNLDRNLVVLQGRK
jgi:hypothetical protein